MRATVDLPEPDSPTSPKVRPRAMSKLTPSTACSTFFGWRASMRTSQPAERSNSRDRPCTRISGGLSANAGGATVSACAGGNAAATALSAPISGTGSRCSLSCTEGIAAISARVYGSRGRSSTWRTGPVSSTRPWYITITRSAASAITPMSCVMSIAAVPRSRQTRRNTRITCACTDTSSAVVGSSAISSCGSAHSASAIATRWRMPPENWCGYWSMRLSGSGISTSASSASARRRASCSLTGRCVRMVSMRCRPIG
ncbi:hypothetical protein FQZ97_559760 [compost metagenome]